MTCMCPQSFCVEWFRSRHPIISVPNQRTTMLVVQVMSVLQGTTLAEKLWNDRIHSALDTLGTKRCATGYRV